MTDIESEHKPTVLFKYGGNAMTNENLKKQVLQNICFLKNNSYNVVIVHGGGPFIKEALAEAKIESEFIDGHRKTSERALEYVEMALKGKVNSNIVNSINSLGFNAVGLSGKDGKSVIAKKRFHKRIVNGISEEVDLGQVGDVLKVDDKLINILISEDYIPVLSCVASDENGKGYNINADMFAGHIAAKLKADLYVVLTDVDGLMMDKDNPESLIKKLSFKDTTKLIENGTIAGGMIPKIESCQIAIKNGAKSARIINGTSPDQISMLNEENAPGTLITKQ